MLPFSELGPWPGKGHIAWRLPFHTSCIPKQLRQFFISIGFLTLLSAQIQAEPSSQELLDTVKGFYTWVQLYEKTISALEPKIINVPNSTRFYLDTTTQQLFINQFLSTGYFSSEFPLAVARYYTRYKNEFEALTQKEFDQYAQDGRGPMMEVEDMDIYFCAQEYEYTSDFINGLKIVKTSFSGDRAVATLESPYKWQTEFHFQRKNNRWLISGYCVYQ